MLGLGLFVSCQHRLPTCKHIAQQLIRMLFVVWLCLLAIQQKRLYLCSLIGPFKLDRIKPSALPHFADIP